MTTSSTLIMNWLKSVDPWDMMGYSKKSSKQPKQYLKNEAPYCIAIASCVSEKTITTTLTISDETALIVDNTNYGCNRCHIFGSSQGQVWVLVLLKTV